MRFPTTSRTLIDRLADGGEEPWKEFFDRYQNVIRDLGIYRGLTAPECDDLVQEVMKRFLVRSRTLHYDPERARFRTIFGRIIGGIIVDIKRKRPRTVRIGEEDIQAIPDETTPSPDRILDEALLQRWREIVRNEILIQLRNMMTPFNYSIFETHVLQHVPAEETARRFGVTAARVYLVKSRANRRLRGLVRAAVENDPELELAADDF